MSLLDAYHSRACSGTIDPDPAQVHVAERLDALVKSLAAWKPRTGLASLFKSSPPPRGLYIHGPVGRGKTMLMDLFFEHTQFKPKRRLHFHAFMAEVHERIGKARKTGMIDPLPEVAKGLADETGCCASTSCMSRTLPTR